MPMLDFRKSSPELVARFAELTARFGPEVTRRSMFGYPSCTVGGHMFTSLAGEDLILRLDPDDRAEFLESHGAADFEPMPGRVMTGFVVAPKELVASDTAIGLWIDRAFVSAAARPPKQPKPRKARTS